MSPLPSTICALLLAVASLGAAGPLRRDDRSWDLESKPRQESCLELPDPGRTSRVSLHGILAYADRHALLLGVARAQEQLGEAEMTAAAVLLPENPELELRVGPKIGSTGQGIEMEVSLAQAIEIAGQRGLRIDAAGSERDVARLRLEDARWQVHRLVHEAFHNALLARERAAAAARVLEFATRLDQITMRQLDAGEVSQVQVRLAKGELAQARQARVAADGVAHLTRLRLAEVSGWPTDTPPEVSGHLDEPRRAPELAELMTKAQQNNPQLAVRKSAATAARARATLAAREAWPSPSLGVAYAHERDPGGAPGLHIGMVTLGLPLPLWNRNQGERARANARATVAQAQHEAASALVAAQIVETRAAVDVAAQRIEAFGSEIIPAFEGNLSLLERAFELGEIDLLQVMVGRGRFLEIERDALAAYDDYFAAIAELEALLGVEVWDDEHHSTRAPEEQTP